MVIRLEEGRDVVVEQLTVKKTWMTKEERVESSILGLH